MLRKFAPGGGGFNRALHRRSQETDQRPALGDLQRRLDGGRHQLSIDSGTSTRP